jgi:hypothetical protein
MAVVVRLEAEELRVHLRGLEHFDAAEARLEVPYGCVRAARAEAYAPPPGEFRLGTERVPYAAVRAGHMRVDGGWWLVCFDDPERVLVLELDGFEFALRPYRRLVLGVEEPEAVAAALAARLAPAGSPAPDEWAWTALAAGMAVFDRHGVRIGTVTHPLGDLGADLFEGVAFRHGPLGAQRMARPEEIARIDAGGVHLALDAREAARLPAVALEDLRRAEPGGGLFRRRPGWQRESDWDQGGPG